MRILYHHRTASRDGQAVHIDEMIAALRAAGHEVLVVAPEPAPAAGAMGGTAGWVQRMRARLPRALYELLELGYSLVAYRRLAAAARRFQPDVLYERYNLFLLAGVMLRRRLGLPMLLEVNAPLAQERASFGGLGLPWLARWAEDRVWRAADMVLPVTQVLAQAVAARGVPPARIRVIPNGINTAHFAAAPAPAQARAALGLQGALVLGFTGFVRDWHGVDRVLRWLAGPQAPAHAVLLVVGDGPARADLQALAQQLGIAPRVVFTGVVPRPEVPGLVAAFDIALQPASVPYASPLKLFEYLALGKAVVAPRQPNLEEVLTDGDNALLFDPAQPGALEAALQRLCHDQSLRQRVAAGSAATIGRLGLTWQGNARRVADLAASLAAAAPPAAAHRRGA
jgi:glycosyltransferase involved in cell wall biosynthesis